VSEYLVIGASGQTGTEIVQRLRARGQIVIGTGFKKSADVPLDLGDAAAVDALLAREKPRVIFIPGGMTNVDECERRPERAMEVNARAPGRIAQAAKKLGALVVHFSTDYVFDGSAGPYGECDAPNPINHYGRSKLEGEKLVEASGARHCIVRTCVVFSPTPGHGNFFMQVYSKLSSGQKITPFIDQFVNPTYAPRLAEAAIKIADDEMTSILHVGGADWVSRVEFCTQVAERFGFSKALLEPIETAKVPLPAKRPLKAGLEVDLARARGLTIAGLKEALDEIARKIRSSPGV
jgi:dTDP-4-dehydrorhamnose reductase